MPSLRLPLLLAGLLTGAGCESYYREYRELTVGDLEFDQVWDACLQSARTEFRFDRTGVDAGLKQFTSRWQTDLRAFGKGRRRRVHVEIESEGPRQHLIRYYVERQTNGEMARPFNPQEDDWESDGQDVEVETRFMHHLRIRLASAAGRPMPGVRGVRIEDPMRSK